MAKDMLAHANVTQNTCSDSSAGSMSTQACPSKFSHGYASTFNTMSPEHHRFFAHAYSRRHNGMVRNNEIAHLNTHSCKKKATKASRSYSCKRPSSLKRPAASMKRPAGVMKKPSASSKRQPPPSEPLPQPSSQQLPS